MDCPDVIHFHMDPDSRDGRSEDDGGFIAESVLKTVIFPSDLVSSILYHVKNNSDNGIETLRTLGGRLGCDNKLRVTHLLLPRQMLTSSSSPWTGTRT